jgi:hypothetical protein
LRPTGAATDLLTPATAMTTVLQSPLTDAMLEWLDTRPREVVIMGKLTDDEYQRVGQTIADFPAPELLVMQAHDSSKFSDLEFLRFFPRLSRFGIVPYDVQDMSGLRHLPDDLQALTLSASYPGRFSLQPISHLRALREIGLEGPRYVDVDVLSRLSSLEQIGLRSFTLPDISLFLPLDNLWFLALRLGGTRDFRLLPRLDTLKYLEIWRVAGLTDASAIGNVESLQLLFLQSLGHIRELPSLRDLHALRHITLDGLKRLTNLRPVCEAVALESVHITHMPQLEPDDVRCLLQLPNLRRASIGLGTKQKSALAAQILNLPPAPYSHAGDDFHFQ